jgi:hypothetical protein
MDLQFFFCDLPTLSTFFHFVDFSRFGNGCCMEHLQGFGLGAGAYTFNSKSK